MWQDCQVLRQQVQWRKVDQVGQEKISGQVQWREVQEGRIEQVAENQEVEVSEGLYFFVPTVAFCIYLPVTLSTQLRGKSAKSFSGPTPPPSTPIPVPATVSLCPCLGCRGYYDYLTLRPSANRLSTPAGNPGYAQALGSCGKYGQTNRQAFEEADGRANRRTYEEADGETNRQAFEEADGETNRRAFEETDARTNLQAFEQANKQGG